MDMKCSKRLSVGNRHVDSLHKNVFGIINMIANAVMSGDSAALLEAFAILEHDLNAYFLAEAQLAETVDFDFDLHCQIHQSLLEDYRRMQQEWLAKCGISTKYEKRNFIDALKKYLVVHINEDSKPLRIVLETHYYDLQSDCSGAAFSTQF